MSRISGQNTRPELVVRSGLHRRGLRFSLHRKDLPGNPDIVLPAYNTAIFVHGCFWHCHDCKYFRFPKSNREFWRKKLRSNTLRDGRAICKLLENRWYVATVWECAVRNQDEQSVERMVDRLSSWIRRDRYRRHHMIFRG